ncbi:MAG: hypothetical protein E6R03_17020 [Hyphomicrobiaceae bacterium]|nr:MAG: hypothetical protein E6R03_17020 [Hyphomicrobiaceae bacterium]
MKTIPMSDVVRDVLLRSIQACPSPSENVLALAGQLDRPTYEATNRVLEAFGGKWSRSKRGHTFPKSVSETFADFVAERGELIIVDEKRTYDVYETPDLVIDKALLLYLCRGQTSVATWLEPSAGSGRLAKAMREKFPSAAGTAIEIRHCKIAGEPDTIIRSDFLRVTPDTDVLGKPVGTFDLIFANPPFSNALDVEHVIHMLRFAHEKGHPHGPTRLVTILSPAFLHRDLKSCLALRRWWERRVRANERDTRFDILPEGTFKGEGTNVRSILLGIDVTSDDWAEVDGYLRESQKAKRRSQK